MGKYVAPECDSSFRGGGERRPEKVSRRKKKILFGGCWDESQLTH